MYAELRTGGLSREGIRGAVRRGDLARGSRGVYGPPGTKPGDLHALFRRLPAGSVLGFHTAAEALGLPAPPSDRIHVIVPADADVPLIRGVAAHASILPMADPVLVDGIACVLPQRCAIDLARVLRRQDALPILDAALRSGLCFPEDLATEVNRHAGLRGIRKARELITHADPRAECVQESQLRLLLLDGRLPPPEPQIWVHDGQGYPVHRLDMGYRDRKIGIEYDGITHHDRQRLSADRARHNWLSGHGWQMRYFTARDLYRTPFAVVDSIRPLLAP